MKEYKKLSSILRALKKLDEDAMSQEPATSEQKQKINMRQMVHRRTRSPRGINRLLAILLAALLLGAAAWVFINTINSNKKQPMTPKTTKQENSPEKPSLTHLHQQQSTPTAPTASTLKKELKKESPGESEPSAINSEPLQRSTKPTFPGKGRPPQPDTKHPELILNGVLWSDKPGRRVALINDRYLKEGDTINGVSVVKIERKAVTLQSGEEKWTLRVKK